MSSARPVLRRVFLSLGVFPLLWVTAFAQAEHPLDKRYGTPQPQQRVVETLPDQGPHYRRDIEPILANRCVVCHACYDAPCQLKLQSHTGLDRGANKALVYDGARLLAANLTRMHIDADNAAEWREKDFYPVLNERSQTVAANLTGSVLYQMLRLKTQHPLPDQAVLPDSFDFQLNRDQQCPTIEEFDDFADDYPLWGMPYGLPQISDREFETIEAWIAQGGKLEPLSPLSVRQQQWVDRWERFFNADSRRERLMNRYIYEHLFLANLYHPADASVFFKLVRSRTPPGQPIDIIATRRPYDDPGSAPFYYRLQRQTELVVVKNHLPYRLDEQRMKRWQSLFLEPDYTVEALPSYAPAIASNPFAAFADLPVQARYQFMLDEAQFTIMGFIKGPVCRGQTALNVIQDRFWVMFVNPDQMPFDAISEFLQTVNQYLRLPAEEESEVLELTRWFKYSEAQKQYLEAKRELTLQRFPTKGDVSLDVVWDGRSDGLAYYDKQGNPNAALTVFRHFDSATVAKGFIGDVPKTAWLIDYPLLERIHYLLVAGFDVYGNVGHQLWTRLYMDFLRMEGEYNFLALLPKDTIEREIDNWYQGEESRVKDYVKAIQSWSTGRSRIDYRTANPKRELFEFLFERFQPGVTGPDPLNWTGNKATLSPLQQLARVRGEPLNYLSEVSLLRIGNGDSSDALYSLIVNRAHSNVANFLFEQYRLLPAEQTATLVEGVLGDYPNTFFKLKPTEITAFIQAINALDSEQDYRKLMDRFGVRRTAPDFWAHSDWLISRTQVMAPIDGGILDYNRLENR